MRLNELNSYLADPTRLSPETLPAVRQLYESYPYCGVFAFLYLYNLALAEDVRYPSELRRLAVLLPDRERLFRLVEAQKEHFTPVEEAESEEDTFSLIDSFLEGVRSTGEDLPESLHLEVPAEVGDYFSGQDFAQVDLKDEELLSSKSVKEHHRRVNRRKSVRIACSRRHCLKSISSKDIMIRLCALSALLV